MDDDVVGWCPTQATVRSGVRWSSYRAFLRRARHRDNLHIFTYATATKVTNQTSQSCIQITVSAFIVLQAPLRLGYQYTAQNELNGVEPFT